MKPNIDLNLHLIAARILMAELAVETLPKCAYMYYFHKPKRYRRKDGKTRPCCNGTRRNLKNNFLFTPQ